MHYLGACVIAKNEGQYLAEWVYHHVLAGVERFIVYDNAEHPILEDQLRDFVAGNLVEVVHWPFSTSQLNVYQHCLDTYSREFKWLGFWDADEFMVPKDPEDIRGVLCDFEPFAGLAVSSMLFGSSGHIRSPQGLQVENYLEPVAPNQHIKTILQPLYAAAPLSPHHFQYKPGALCVGENGLPVPGPTAPHSSSRIRLNHYFFRSQEDWCRKMERGLAHPLADGGAYRLEQFFEHLAWPRTRDESMRPWAARIRELSSRGQTEAVHYAEKWAGLSGGEWVSLLEERLARLDEAITSGTPLERDLETFFAVLPCYNLGNPYICNILSMFHRETGKVDKAWEWIKRSLMLNPTPEAYYELMLWHRAQGSHAQAAFVKEWLRAQLVFSGQLTPAWNEMLAD